MKKTLLIVIALALVFTLALTLAACGGSTEQNPDSGTPSTPDGGQPPETPDGGEQTPETPDEGDEGETPVPPVTYTVTFETNGGSAVKAVTVDEGDAITPAPETTLEGYEFGGWYSSSDLSDDSLVTFPYTPAGSTTLYAKWSKILTAADLYNEVFGEDYAFVSFENFTEQLVEKYFVTLDSYRLLFKKVSTSEFTIYAHAKYTTGSEGLITRKYTGNQCITINDYYDLSCELGSLSIKEYAVSLVDSKMPYDHNVSTLETLREKTDLYNNISIDTIVAGSSNSTLIRNTTTEIEFADYAAKFMPAGVTPIACYVGECGPCYIDEKYFVEYVGLGYYSVVKTTLVFMNNDGSIAVSEYEFIVRALNNKEASESIYNRLLNGNETTDYIVSNVDTTTIENPIWTGYTVGVTK